MKCFLWVRRGGGGIMNSLNKKICINATQSRESLLKRGMLSTVNLLVLTSLVQLLYIFKTLFTLIAKQATLIRRLIV